MDPVESYPEWEGCPSGGALVETWRMESGLSDAERLATNGPH